MFAWALKPSPSRWPAKAMQPSPVCAATAPARVDRRRPAGSAPSSSASSSAASAVAGCLPAREAVEQARAVGRLGDRLGRHRADARPAPR